MRNHEYEWDVVVVGAGGAQAQAMFEAAARGGLIHKWLAVDRSWRADRRRATEGLGIRMANLDVIDAADELRDLLGRTRLAANFAGPFYHTGGAVLDACIDMRTDYVDICDDADATLELLARDERASAAGVRALIGMGSSPGITNVLARLAVDVLGRADEVDICWIVDIADVGDAAIQHFWHTFSGVSADGDKKGVSEWQQLERRTVEFPLPLGERTVVELSHPEPHTIPRFLPVRKARNFGGIVPEDALVVNWALARLGAAGGETISHDGRAFDVSAVATALYARYRQSQATASYLGGGLVVDVHTSGNGLRFASGDETSMDEATGIPAAAGISLMVGDELPAAGVFGPEYLRPAAVFSALGRVSRRRGSLAVYRLADGRAGERLRIRELLAERTGSRR